MKWGSSLLGSASMSLRPKVRHVPEYWWCLNLVTLNLFWGNFSKVAMMPFVGQDSF